MSRTTRCLFALGLSVSLAAACGDDDDDGFGGGGSSGRAGSGGRAGAAGTAGASGSSGAAGSGGDAGSGGTGGTDGGSGGTGGSSGNGGSGGTGGSGTEPPDAGPDAAPDGGDVEEPPVDAGPEPIACGDLDAETAGAGTSTNTQAVIFTRLVFVGPDAPGCNDAIGCIEVTFRSVVDGFVFAPPLLLCTGSEAVGDCDDGVQALEGGGVGDAGTALAEDEEVTFTTGLGAVVTPAAGELALINGQPGVGDPIVRAYINWGGYVSRPAPNDGETLEEAAIDDDVWSLGDTVDVNGQTTIYADGDVVDENGFDVCTQVP